MIKYHNINIKIMELYIKEHDDYRSGPDLSVYTKEELKIEYQEEDDSNDELITDEQFQIKLDMDEDLLDIITLNNEFNDVYVVYLICGEGYHQKTDIIYIMDYNNEIEARNILIHLYSDINNRQPFVETGFTSSYKSTGYYPEVLPKYFIDDQPLITDEIKIALEKPISYCAAIIIFNEKLIDYLQIRP